jgi:hypothetical protein
LNVHFITIFKCVLVIFSNAKHYFSIVNIFCLFFCSFFVYISDFAFFCSFSLHVCIFLFFHYLYFLNVFFSRCILTLQFQYKTSYSAWTSLFAVLLGSAPTGIVYVPNKFVPLKTLEKM